MKPAAKQTKERAYAEMVDDSSDFVSFIHGFKRPLFISSEKKDEYRVLKQLGAVKIIIGVLACVLVCIGLYAAFVSFVMPYFMTAAKETEIPEEVQQVIKDLPVVDAHAPLSYDRETGLPVYDDGLNLFIINSDYPVDEDFSVPTEVYSGVTVDKRIVSSLIMLVNKAADDGITLEFSGGLVTFGEQKALYEKKVDELVSKDGYTRIMARAEAKKTVSYPGEADAQSGLTITIKGDGTVFKGSEAYNWLNKNAATYGFVFRYPEGKSQHTGRNEDYTVIRYVGKQNALMMRQLSMCLEEYVVYMSQK